MSAHENAAAVASACIVSFIVGAIIGAWLMQYDWQYTAIKNGAAHYDAKTGEFKWNNPLKLEEKP